MKVRVKFFGPVAQLLGAREAEVELPESDLTCERLSAVLSVQQPRLREAFVKGRFAVNQEFAEASQRIGPRDEVAFIGVVSGG